MTRSMQQHEDYGQLMDQASVAIRDRNEEALVALTEESSRLCQDIQNVWSDVLTSLEVRAFDDSDHPDVEELSQAVQESLEKLHATQDALALWGEELGTSLRSIQQGRTAIRGYTSGTNQGS